MSRLAAGLTCLMLAALPASAQTLYSDRDLDVVRGGMARNIALMVSDDIPDALPPGQRQTARRIDVVFPDAGPNPLAFWAQPATGRIFVPLASVRFIDDLAITMAWFERHGCNGGYIQAYLYGLLRAGRPLGPPLVAFGIDRDRALADAYVNDVSGKVLKTAVYFIMAHEVGHILLGHAGGLTGAASQAQERAADAFAMDVFAHDGAPPAGMVLYFLTGRWRDPIGAQAATGTHPVSPDRIAAVADRMAADPGAFSHAEPDRARGADQVRRIARDMGRIAALTSDEAMLTLLPVGLDAAFPAQALRTACPGG